MASNKVLKTVDSILSNTNLLLTDTNTRTKKFQLKFVVQNKYCLPQKRKDLRQSLRLSLIFDVKICTIPIAPAASHVLVKQF